MSGLGKLKGLCGRCSKRGECKELCEKAERYAAQDEIEWAEDKVVLVSDLPGFDDLECELTSEADMLDTLLHNAATSFLMLDEMDQSFPERLNFDCLSRLNNEILRLKYFEKLTFKEIARRVHRKVAAVQGRYYRSIEKLKRIYGKQEQAA